MQSEKIRTLLADSGAFIKGAPLQQWSSNVVTIKDVVNEIRDANTRQRLQVLPYKLTFREPSQAAISHVTDFAKKTGDYHSLSATDLRLIALTYQLECEEGPSKGEQLRTEPLKTSTQNPIQRGGQGIFTAGFYKGYQIRKKSSSISSSTTTDSINSDTTPPPITSDTCNVTNIDLPSTSTELSDESTTVTNSLDLSLQGCYTLPCDKENVNTPDTSTVQQSMNNEIVAGLETLCVEDNENVGSDVLTNKLDKEDNCASDVMKGEEKKEITNNSEENGDEEIVEEEELSDSDDEGWVTPENIHEVCEKMGGVMEEQPEKITVGCITTDYSMQNVLLQMGLQVVSVDGMLIKRLQTYAQQCKACFKTSFKMGAYFCPHCGNKTMIKVLAQTAADGTVQYRPLSNKQFSHKGLRYSMPLPKGGRQPDKPILAPDQKITFRLPRSRERLNPLDPDYIAHDSPFQFNDVTSRGAQIAFRHGRKMQGGGWHRNPNQVRKKK